MTAGRWRGRDWAPWQADRGGANLAFKPSVTGVTDVLLCGCHQKDMWSALV